jgi:hypothetical protein
MFLTDTPSSFTTLHASAMRNELMCHRERHHQSERIRKTIP